MPTELKPYINQIIAGDALHVMKKLPSESIDCVVTSPPYWKLRDYGVSDQLGLEPSLQEYVDRLCLVFDEVKRVLKSEGTCFVNLGDTYFTNKGATHHFKNRRMQALQSHLGERTFAGGSAKSLCQIPSRFAIEMCSRGWLLRNEIIWWKPNAMPESVRDRFTTDYEKLFFFVKSKRYHFAQQFEEIKSRDRLSRRLLDPDGKHKHQFGDNYISSINPKTAEASRLRMLSRGRNKRCVWRIPTKGYKGSHFAVYPQALVETPILAGCPKGGVVLDPFVGSGTTAVVARNLGRRFIGVDLNQAYARLAKERLARVA